MTKPSKIISDSYIELAKNTLKRVETMLNEKDFLWATVMIYYAEYYALYSFLRRIGIKCENHFCSILLATCLLGKEITKTIEEHKDRRIDAQYYLRIVREDKINEMFRSAKIFVAEFEDIVSKINERKIRFFRNKIKRLLR
ncbi:MAG: HEPN domain-containing protein [Candidatus Aenigmatarchaeota archaeon]